LQEKTGGVCLKLLAFATLHLDVVLWALKLERARDSVGIVLQDNSLLGFDGRS